MTAHVLPLVHRFRGHEHVRAVGELFQERGLPAAHVAFDVHGVRRLWLGLCGVHGGDRCRLVRRELRSTGGAVFIVATAPEGRRRRRENGEKTAGTRSVRRRAREQRLERADAAATAKQRTHRFLTAKSNATARSPARPPIAINRTNASTHIFIFKL